MNIRNKNKKKYFFVGIGLICFIIFSSYICGNLISQNNTLKSNLEDLKQKNDNLELSKKHLEKELYDLKEIGNQEIIEKKECNFIKTYKILHIFNNYKTDLDYTFIVVDQYQQFYPIIIKLPNKYLAFLEINQYYEFSFSGDSTMSSDEYQIQQVNKTNKVGNAQTQEVCI